jgi:hypothetical protein
LRRVRSQVSLSHLQRLKLPYQVCQNLHLLQVVRISLSRWLSLPFRLKLLHHQLKVQLPLHHNHLQLPLLLLPLRFLPQSQRNSRLSLQVLLHHQMSLLHQPPQSLRVPLRIYLKVPSQCVWLPEVP